MDIESPSRRPHKPMINHNNNEAETSKTKNHKCRNICLVVTAVLLVTTLIFVILGFTVFKAKKPETTINNVSLKDFDFSLDFLNMKVNLNVTIGISASIKNPNKVSFKFRNSSALVIYRGETVGDAPIPADHLDSDGTLPLNLTLTLMADRLMSNSQLYRDALAGTVPLSTFTRVSGKVKILGFIKIHVVSRTTCDFKIFVNNSTIGDKHCSYKTKL